MGKRVEFFSENYRVGGFATSCYDLEADQPTTVNWTRQTRFDGPHDARVAWKAPINSNVSSCSLVIGRSGILYFGSRDGYLHAVFPDGQVKWKIRLDNALTTPVIGFDGTIYIGTTGGKWNQWPQNLCYYTRWYYKMVLWFRGFDIL